MTRKTLHDDIENAKGDEAFRNYLHVRDRVLEMLEQAQRESELPSRYWEEELAGFDYMLDASPLIIRRLREHCYHLTGLRSYDYRGHHSHKREAFAGKLQALRQLDQDNVLVPESPLLGGFGHLIDGDLINIDTLKFYESMIALSKSGLLQQFRGNVGQNKIVMEIGAGWGGFAYQFKTLCPNTCYIIIDLPQTLLFSGVYLKTLFPKASVLFYGDKPTNTLLDGYEAYDFIFLPHFFFDKMELPRLDLALNMVSFQEMTSTQVDRYIRKLTEIKCPYLYSLNRDRSSHNDQLSSVSSIMGNYYNLREVKVLNIPYTDISVPGASRDKGGAILFRIAATLAGKLLQRGEINNEQSVHKYKHLVGSLKQE